MYNLYIERKREQDRERIFQFNKTYFLYQLKILYMHSIGTKFIKNTYRNKLDRWLINFFDKSIVFFSTIIFQI